MYHLIVENKRAYLFHKGNLVNVSDSNMDTAPHEAVMLDGHTFAADVNGVDVLYFLPDTAEDALTESITLDTAGRIVGNTYCLSAVKHGAIKLDAVAANTLSVNN